MLGLILIFFHFIIAIIIILVIFALWLNFYGKIQLIKKKGYFPWAFGKFLETPTER